MNKSILTVAILSALLISTATLTNALATQLVPLTEVILKPNLTTHVVKLAIIENDLTDNDATVTISATDNKNNAKTSVSTQASAVEPSDSEVSAIVISNAIASAFSATTPSAGAFSFNRSDVKSIKNAPYRAEVVTEDIQTLNDGNQIVKRNMQSSFRDSAGRMRTELNDAEGNLRGINIYDAVENINYFVNPKQKSANKIVTDPNLSKRIQELQEINKQKNRDGKSISTSRSPSEEIVISRVERPRNADGAIAAGATTKEEVKVSVIRASDQVSLSTLNSNTANSVNMPRIDIASFGALTNAFVDRTWATKATTKQLGTKDIEGVRVEGKLRSYTIPAGEVGNKSAITVSTETWVSPELQITLYSKHSDPRVGDKIYRLQNIKRGEQPLDLFSVPAGYQIKESPAMKFDFKTK